MTCMSFMELDCFPSVPRKRFNLYYDPLGLNSGINVSMILSCLG